VKPGKAAKPPQMHFQVEPGNEINEMNNIGDITYGS
jgi:hypothetical protein